jgi:hypothetical protein
MKYIEFKGIKSVGISHSSIIPPLEVMRKDQSPLCFCTGERVMATDVFTLTRFKQ